MEKTFVMIKSDGVKRGLIGEIIGRFERKGYRILRAELQKPNQEKVEEHYEEHRDRPYFQDLVEFMMEGPVFPMILEGEKVIEVVRLMIGDKDPAIAMQGTIRGDYANTTTRNLVHAADSIESAEREIRLWFPER